LLISVCTPCCPVALLLCPFLLFEDGSLCFRGDFVYIDAFVAVLHVLGIFFLFFCTLVYVLCAFAVRGLWADDSLGKVDGISMASGHSLLKQKDIRNSRASSGGAHLKHTPNSPAPKSHQSSKALTSKAWSTSGRMNSRGKGIYETTLRTAAHIKL